MYRHLFFTGEKGIGKSTLIRQILMSRSFETGGFFTKRCRSGKDGLLYTHLLRPQELPSEKNILFCCGGPASFDPVCRFEQLGCAALRASAGCSLLLMDELGPHEEQAFLFQEKVLEILDGAVPVLGVLQKAQSPFLSKIAAHPAVLTAEVTPGNRDLFLNRCALIAEALENTALSADLFL